MHFAFGPAILLQVVSQILIAATAEPEFLSHGRLLLQLASGDSNFAIQLEATAPPQKSSGAKEWISKNQKWIFIGTGGLCGVLVVVLVAQWAHEIVAWRRHKKRLDQDEACRRHVELYAADIESPEKVGPSPGNPDAVAADPQRAPSESSPPPPTIVVSRTSSSTRKGIKLPPSVMLRRAPSLRSDFVGISIRSGSNSREGSPRAAPSLGRSSSSSSFTRRSGPSLRRTGSSICSSPKSVDPKEYSVDASVKARDVNAVGWVPHPHARRSPANSGPGTPIHGINSPGSYNLSPGKLEYSMASFAQYSSDDESATRSGTLSRSPAVPGGSFQKQPSPKPLVRMGTEAGIGDFRLTTSVAEDGEEEVESSTAKSQHQASSGEGSAAELSTAKSIKPKQISALNSHSEDHEGTDSPTGSASTVAVTPQQPRSLPAIPTSPRTLALTGAQVAVLSPEQFNEEIHLLRMLGAGGAGTVHEGLWRGHRVAVKLLHPSRQASASAADAFRKEVEIMARVGPHPGVIAVLAACFQPPHMAIIVELAERGSLHSILHEEGLRPRYGTLLNIAEDVACAVAHCHSLKLVHRDLKTHNVLLDSNGRARVADFGLAAAKHRTFLTVEPGALGTASVMAPEQFAAHEVSERCDSYAFGVFLWELITGRQPWEECTNIMQIVMLVGCQRSRPPMPPGCPPPLAKLIRECWRHNAALRPGFLEIIERLRQIRREDAAAGALKAAEDTPSFEKEAGESSIKSLGRYLSNKVGQQPQQLSRLAVSSS